MLYRNFSVAIFPEAIPARFLRFGGGPVYKFMNCFKTDSKFQAAMAICD